MTTPCVTAPVEPTEEVRDAVAWLQKAFPKDAVGFSTSYRPTMTAVHTVISALSAAPAPEGGAIPEWVVNDIAELGLKIGNRFFWLYKGQSLVYGVDAEDVRGGIVQHEEGGDMHWRTRKEAPADHHDRNLSMTNDELIEQALSHPPLEAPAEAGEDAEAIVRRWANWIIDESSDMDHDDHDAGKRKIRAERDFILSALRAQPPAREDAQPVAWRYRFVTSTDGKDWSDWFIVDGRTYIPTRDNQTIQPLYTNPAPDALRVARGALEPFNRAYQAYLAAYANFMPSGATEAEKRFAEGERKDTAEEAAFEVLSKITLEQLCAVNGALAALQAEQGAK